MVDHVALAPAARQHASCSVAGAVLAIARLLALTAPAAALEYVAHALDGDTIVMLNGECVRLENVDAPELRARLDEAEIAGARCGPRSRPISARAPAPCGRSS